MTDPDNVLEVASYVKLQHPFYDGALLHEPERFGNLFPAGTKLPRSAKVLRPAEEPLLVLKEVEPTPEVTTETPAPAKDATKKITI